MTPLSDLVYRRTLGNGLFAVKFLSNLADRDLLSLNVQTLSWTWQIEQLQAETDISENVLDLLSRKLKTLSKEVLSILIVASCLNSTLEYGVLHKVVHRLMDTAGERGGTSNQGTSQVVHLDAIEH